MNGLAYLFIFGTLTLWVSSIVGGAYLHHSWYGALLIILGIVGGIAWLIMLINIANALNSDI